MSLQERQISLNGSEPDNEVLNLNLSEVILKPEIPISIWDGLKPRQIRKLKKNMIHPIRGPHMAR